MRLYFKSALFLIVCLFPATSLRLVPRIDASEEALVSMVSDERVAVTETWNYWSFLPTTAGKKPVGFIFYTGKFVDERAYAPIIRALAAAGFPSFLLKTPRDLAILSPCKANKVIRTFDNQVDSWVVGGHGLGGWAAALYAKLRNDRVDGLVLLSSYPGRRTDLSDSETAVLSMWGTLDTLTPRSKWEEGNTRLPEDARLVEIVGGNHAQMGYYGPQEGDSDATITPSEQHFIVTVAILQLLTSLE